VVGIFSYQQYQFLYIFEGLGMENYGIITPAYFILWSFGKFFPFWYVVPKKNLAILIRIGNLQF
jgi:hypothetical protein